MSDIPKDDKSGTKKPAVTLTGTVEKITLPNSSNEPGMAWITLEGAEMSYREICVDGTLQDEAGHSVTLKVGAEVKVKIEAESEATTLKKQASAKESTEQNSVRQEIIGHAV